MSQKTNSISNKLNLIKISNYEFYKYGRNFKSYIKFIGFRKYVFKYISRFCLKYNLLLENVNITQISSKTFMFIHILNLKNKTNFKIKKHFHYIISNWLRVPVLLYFYKNTEFGNSSFLLINYISYLFQKRDNPPKKTIQLVYDSLKLQSGTTKVEYTINGIRVVKLKGFKLEVSGCFDSARSLMAKKLKCNFGRVPLTQLKGYIDYSAHTFFTKSGSCGFKIWLFYEFK